MKKYDLFLFDADGTLYDYDKAEKHALQAMFAHCNFRYADNILARYREINEEVWDDYEKGGLSKSDMQTLRFSRLFEEIGIEHDAVDFNAKYLAELGKGTFLIDGAEEICRDIVSQNKSIFIVTNGILATQEARIKHSLIKDYISDFFVSEFVGYKKPEREYFEYVFSRIPKIAKEKILIIGDSLANDIAGGNNAGIDTCWFNENENENHTNTIPTYEIKKLSELQKFV
ncbi:MAG: YjjG family noncanonical pyrimidine nucleotidase [Defluviitaleaceae bacterium]|nr:YjjG family noncanonical pyrimidine nucleotidase [Defluviitaleaceae bacterium]